MHQALPHIPGDAPFSPQQREWLNGMLADLLARTVSNGTSSPAVPSVRLTIYFATQSGTAERLAKKLLKQMKASGHIAELLSLESVTPSALAQQENAIFIASTYGEGDPPDSAKRFRDALQDAVAPSLRKLRYAVFCLGDRHYEQFCQFGIELDERLHVLGATRFIPRVESDVEVDEPFAAWLRALEPTLAEGKHISVSTTNLPASEAEVLPQELPQHHTRDNPYHAELRARHWLTSGTSGKQTIHLGFALEGSDVHYQAGDACGVIAQNDDSLVHEILSLLPFDGSVKVEIPKLGRFTIAEALLRHLQPTRLTRKVVQAFADKTRRKKLLGFLKPEHASDLDAFIHGRGLIDLLHDYPNVIASPDELVQMLPRLAPRLYSISSSPAAHTGEVHCTVAIVRYRAHNRDRNGVASTMLAERAEIGTRIPIYIQPNRNFRLPQSTTPIIMIGPGTGIAPFRAFLHERQALAHTGPNWLFFGERSASSDFLYKSEILGMQKSGHLTRLDTAFSRDQAHKIYVQDRMLEQGAELWRWLNEGAHLFVCGDASRMAKDVDSALHSVIEAHGAMDGEAAREYVSQLHDDRRYHRDVY